MRELLMFSCVGMAVMGLEDLVFDGIWLAKAARGTWRTKTVAASRHMHGMRFAIFIPTWQEQSVIAPMVAHIEHSWPVGSYKIFIACYANDMATRKAVEEISLKTGCVQLVVNPRHGPTTKGDNLNILWQEIDLQIRQGIRIDAIILHDAEDIVHPDELLLYAAALQMSDMVQIPVVPLLDPDSRWIAGHYADEFAEAHTKELSLRCALGAPIPSAGVGTALRVDLMRRITASSATGKPFAEASVTEDYEIGLRAGAIGARTDFVRAIGRNGTLIATHAFFPATFSAATTQKTRWVLGIALAGWDRLADRVHGAVASSAQIGWHAKLIEEWMRWRDRRSILAALFLLTGYGAILLAALGFGYRLWSHNEEPIALGLQPWEKGVMLFTTMMLIWRLAMRTAFTASTYGFAEGLRAIPRIIVSNFVAITASQRAFIRYVGLCKGAPLRWDKTEHRFPPTPASQDNG